MSEASLRIEAYTVAAPQESALVNVSLTVEQPCIVGIVGPPGSGKSLLLKALCGALPRGFTASGRLFVAGAEAAGPSLPGATMVDPNEPPPRGTVLRALTASLPAERKEGAAVEEGLRAAGAWEELQEKLQRPVRDLPPVERLIVAVCRSLVAGSPLLLLDDPTRDLSAHEAARFEEVVHAVAKHIPVLWVSRSLRRVTRAAQRLAVLSEGKLIAEGPCGEIVVSPPLECERAVETSTGHVTLADMEGLYHDLLAMGSRAERAVHLAVRSLTDQNLAIAREVIAGDDEIDQRERQLHDRALSLIGRIAPVGRDLRTLTTILLAATDLERIADHAVNISKVTLAIGEEPLIKPLIDIPRMAEKAQRMVRQGLDAMVRRDASLAEEVLRSDDPVDALYRELFDELRGFITDGGDAYRAGQALHLLFVARFLERVADHATNIAEHVVFMVTGKRVSHRPRTTGSPPEDEPPFTLGRA